MRIEDVREFIKDLREGRLGPSEDLVEEYVSYLDFLESKGEEKSWREYERELREYYKERGRVEELKDEN